MLLTALATFLMLAGCEVLVLAGLGSLGQIANSVFEPLLALVPVVNIVISWYAARRICLWLWPELVTEIEAKPTKRLLRQQEF